MYIVVKCKECWKRKNPRECPMCFEELNEDGSVRDTIDFTDINGFCNRGEKKPREVEE